MAWAALCWLPVDMSGQQDVDPRRNAILRGLPDDERELVLSKCERLWAELRHEVYGRDEPIQYLHFPLSCVFSHVALVDDDVVVEVGTIGPEGVVGLPLFLGATHSPNSVFCQIAGETLRLRAEALDEIINNGAGHLHALLHRYTQALLIQLGQNAACNRIHTAEERAARWLLMTQDRVGADEFPLTQQFLAQMLGVRRPTVSLTAGVLQSAGVIRYTRGIVTIVDRERLLEVACDCYQIVRREFDKLIPS